MTAGLAPFFGSLAAKRLVAAIIAGTTVFAAGWYVSRDDAGQKSVDAIQVAAPADAADQPLLAQRFAETGRRYQQAREEALQAQQRADSARRALNAFVARHEQQLFSASSHDASAAPLVQESSRQIVNPHWSELDREARELDGRLAALSEQMTPEHPQIQKLTSDLTDLKGRIGATPQYISAPNEAPVISASEALRRQAEEQQKRELLATYERMKQAAQQAEADSQQAADVERAAWEEQLRATLATQQPPAQKAVAEQPARSPEQTTPWLILLVITATAAGGAAALVRSKPDLMIATPDEVQRLLGLPVIGILPPVRSRGSRAA